MDKILASWLQRQESDLNEFVTQTDLVTVTPYRAGAACDRYIAEFRCKGLVWDNTRGAIEADCFHAGIYFGPDHLRRIDPLRLVWMLSPTNSWHANILFPAICTGHLRPGVGLVDLLYQIHSILTYQNVNMADFLNRDAAAWARQNTDRFPIDPRPLKRREFQLELTEVTEA